MSLGNAMVWIVEGGIALIPALVIGSIVHPIAGVVIFFVALGVVDWIHIAIRQRLFSNF